MRQAVRRFTSLMLALVLLGAGSGSVAAQAAVSGNQKDAFLRTRNQQINQGVFSGPSDRLANFKPSQPAPRNTASSANLQQSAEYKTEVHLTLPDRSKLVERQADIPFSYQLAPLAGDLSVRVDPAKTFQTMDGVGAAMTESSAYLFSEKLTAPQRSLVFPALFSKANGAGIDVVRTPWGATDFSLSNYTYNDRTPEQGNDIPQNDFSADHDLQYIMPRLQDAKAVNPNLKLYFAPWSPPAWMKVPLAPNLPPLAAGFLKNGQNDPLDLYDSYSLYLTKAVNSYTANGLWPNAFSPQNESVSLRLTDPSTYYGVADHARLVRDYLGQRIATQTYAHPKILSYDDNWDNPYHAVGILNDAGAKQHIAGTAFHCYKSEPTKQLIVQKAHPDKGIYFTECTGSNDPNVNWPGDFRWGMRNLIINATRNYAKTVLYWNLALDENFGPKANGCQTCRGIMTVTSTGGVAFNTEYYILAHYGKYVHPGAHRIESTTFGEGAIETTAFKNPDGSKVLIALNSGSIPRTFSVREGDAAFRYTLPAGAAASFKWTMPDNLKRDIDTGRIEAESYSSTSPAGLPISTITDEGHSDQAVQLAPNQSLAFTNTSFQNTPTSFQLRYRTLTAAGGTVELRLGSASGQLLATVPFTAGTGWQSSAVTVGSSIPPAGSQTLVAVVKGSGTAQLVELNWVKFAQNGPHPDPIAGKANWRAYGVYAPGNDIPANVLDGNNATRWTTGFPMTYGHTFVIDFGKQTALNSFGAYSAGGDRPRNVKVEISDNGLDYSVVQPNYAPPADLYQIPFTTTAMGRYVRLTELSETSQANWWSLNEVNMYYHQ